MTNEEYKQLILLKKHFFEEKIELPIAGEKLQIQFLFCLIQQEILF